MANVMGRLRQGRHRPQPSAQQSDGKFEAGPAKESGGWPSMMKRRHGCLLAPVCANDGPSR